MCWKDLECEENYGFTCQCCRESPSSSSLSLFTGFHCVRQNIFCQWTQNFVKQVQRQGLCKYSRDSCCFKKFITTDKKDKKDKKRGEGSGKASTSKAHLVPK